jgi:hypothetical protein
VKKYKSYTEYKSDPNWYWFDAITFKGDSSVYVFCVYNNVIIKNLLNKDYERDLICIGEIVEKQVNEYF